MTKSLFAFRRTKLKLLLISRENPSVENLNAYKQFRNLYNQLIRARKKIYYSEKIDSSKHDPKSLWKPLNEAINRKQSKKSSINSILVKNLKISNPTEMGISIIQFLKHQYYLSPILKINPILTLNLVYVVLKKSLKLLNH